MRKKRAPEDFLSERFTVNGVIMEVQVCALSDSGTLRNKLRLRFGYLGPQPWRHEKLVHPSTAKEPDKAWDIAKLGSRLAEDARRGAADYARELQLQALGTLCKDLERAYEPRVEQSFEVLPLSFAEEGDFGPLSISIHGLCPHLITKILNIMVQANAEGGCGITEETQHHVTPEELN
jgi:hypothetical protein